MRIPYKPTIVAARIAMLSLVLWVGQSAHCTTMSEASGEGQAKQGMQSLKSASLEVAGNTAEPITIEKYFPLGLGGNSKAQLRAIPMSWQALATLQFEVQGGISTGQANTTGQNQETIRTGVLTWQITSSGTRVKDSRTGQFANIPTLTSSVVRPRDIVYSERLGTVWLYGETVYRYRIAARVLERIQPVGEDFHSIRKAVLDPSGLWLATGKGIFLLGEGGAILEKVVNEGAEGVTFINAATAEKEAWFVTSGARLIRITSRAPNQFEFAVSAKLPGTPAEIIVADQTLWVLLSDKHGDYYKLASVDTDRDRIGVIAGKYFTLGEKDGQITASTYTTYYRIDPRGKTVTRLRLTGAGLLPRAADRKSVLFVGSSYGYKDGCEIVEHGRIDISKGWDTALGDLVFLR